MLTERSPCDGDPVGTSLTWPRSFWNCQHRSVCGSHSGPSAWPRGAVLTERCQEPRRAGGSEPPTKPPTAGKGSRAVWLRGVEGESSCSSAPGGGKAGDLVPRCHGCPVCLCRLSSSPLAQLRREAAEAACLPAFSRPLGGAARRRQGSSAPGDWQGPSRALRGGWFHVLC